MINIRAYTFCSHCIKKVRKISQRPAEQIVKYKLNNKKKKNSCVRQIGNVLSYLSKIIILK